MSLIGCPSPYLPKVTHDTFSRCWRSRAKAVNFGIVYGISDYGLSRDIGVSRKEAALYIENYFARYPGVKKFMDQVVEEAHSTGYVATLFGRRRFLADINSSNFNLRSFAERTAMNTPIQGTAADIIKLAMNQVEKKLEDGNFTSRLLLQVHDELILEVPHDEVAEMREVVPKMMGHAMKLQVELKTSCDVGPTWYDLK